MSQIEISQIYIYPVKSLGGTWLKQSALQPKGLQYDRHWMVVDKDNRFMTQRTHPQMALITSQIENGQLTLSGFGLEDRIVPALEAGGPKTATKVFNDPVNVHELDNETNEWLSQALDTPCKLVSFPDDEMRYCDPLTSSPGDHTQFADAYPLLIISEASLEDLNQRLASPVGMDRFRPNLVVKGCAAFAEDHWTSIEVNGIHIRMLEACSRCSVPTVDQETGIASGPEPIHTLSTYRQRDGEVFFGSNYATSGSGTISVGDIVSVQ